ncbi:hypothetical protein [Thermovibrio sp.]
MERLIWWIALILFIAVITLGIFFFAALVASNPETTAFVLGFLGFWLFANRLIFGFAQIANAASSVIEGEEVNKEEIAKKVASSSELAKVRKLEELSITTLLATFRASLEPFKYTYYFAFFIVLLFAVLFELNVISSVVFGPIVEALTLGAAIPTLFVWGLELLSDHYLAKAAVKLLEEESKQEGANS